MKEVENGEVICLLQEEGELDKTPEEGADIVERVLEKDRGSCQERYERELREIEELRISQRGADPGNLELSGEEAKNESELGESHLVQDLEDVTQEHETEKYKKSIKHAVKTNEKSCNTSELQGDEKEETNTEDDELTADTVFDMDLKDYNTHPDGCLRTSARHFYNNDNCVGSLSAERILDADLQRFNKCGKARVDVLDESQPTVEHEELLEPAAKLETESGEGNTMAGEKNGVNGLHVLANELSKGDGDRKLETALSSFQRDIQNDMSEITDEGAVKKDSGETGVETLQLPKPYKGRPGAGCRLMVEVMFRINITLMRIR